MADRYDEKARAVLEAGACGTECGYCGNELRNVAQAIRESAASGERRGVALCVNWLKDNGHWQLSEQMEKAAALRVGREGA